MILGQPIFPGDSSIHQLVQIIKILGTPSKAVVNEMNPHSEETKLPQLKKQDWKKVISIGETVFNRYLGLLEAQSEQRVHQLHIRDPAVLAHQEDEAPARAAASLLRRPKGQKLQDQRQADSRFI